MWHLAEADQFNLLLDYLVIITFFGRIQRLLVSFAMCVVWRSGNKRCRCDQKVVFPNWKITSCTINLEFFFPSRHLFSGSHSIPMALNQILVANILFALCCFDLGRIHLVKASVALMTLTADDDRLFHYLCVCTFWACTMEYVQVFSSNAFTWSRSLGRTQIADRFRLFILVSRADIESNNKILVGCVYVCLYDWCAPYTWTEPIRACVNALERWTSTHIRYEYFSNSFFAIHYRWCRKRFSLLAIHVY